MRSISVGPDFRTRVRGRRHLVNVVHDFTERGAGPEVLTGHGAAIDTTTASGKLVFGIFAALTEFEHELNSERTTAGLASARARGRKGGRSCTMTPAKVRLARRPWGSPPPMSQICAKNSASLTRDEQLCSRRPASFTGVDAATKQSQKTATERPHPRAGAFRGFCEKTIRGEI